MDESEKKEEEPRPPKVKKLFQLIEPNESISAETAPTRRKRKRKAPISSESFGIQVDLSKENLKDKPQENKFSKENENNENKETEDNVIPQNKNQPAFDLKDPVIEDLQNDDDDNLGKVQFEKSLSNESNDETKEPEDNDIPQKPLTRVPAGSFREPFDSDKKLSDPVLKTSNKKNEEDDVLPLAASIMHFGHSDFSVQTNLNKGVVFVYMIIPPDGGFGWVIVLTSFLCQSIVDGIIFSIGVLLPDISKEFGIHMSYIILISSTQLGFYFLAGTLASALNNAYGFRPVAIAGCIISGFGILIASFSTNISMMILFYSTIGGPGLALVWVSSQLIIGYYFERWRPIANGLAVSGAGFGIIVFCYAAAFLLPALGWRNILRLYVAFMFIALLLSLTFKSVQPILIGKLITQEVQSDSSYEDLYLHTYTYQRRSTIPIQELIRRTYDYDQQQPTGWTCCGKRCRRIKKGEKKDSGMEKIVIAPDPIDKQDLFYTGAPDYETKTSSVTTIPNDEIVYIKTNEEKRITYNISLINLQKKDSTQHLTLNQLKRKKIRCPYLVWLTPTNWIPEKVKHALKLLFDFKLLKTFEFKILLLSAFFFPMGFNIPFVYSKMRAEVDSNIAMLISPTIGLSNFIFRIVSGFIAFKYNEMTTHLCGSGIIFGGIFVFASAFYGSTLPWFQFLYAFCYGVSPAFFSTLRAVIYVRSLGLEKLTSCFGLTALAMGLGVFIGTTTGGLLTVLFSGSLKPAFVFSGLCIITAGLLKVLLPKLVKMRQSAVQSSGV